LDIYHLIPEFLVLSLAGAALSIAAYSAFRDNNDDKKLLLIIASCFSLAFLVIFILAFITLDDLNTIPYILALIFYILIFMAISSIIGFVIHRLKEDQKFKDDELDSAIDIIESSKDGLDSSISLFSSKNKKE
jgi:ABC-type transport system involved in multi-copper enzyme maturation permease subunit